MKLNFFLPTRVIFESEAVSNYAAIFKNYGQTALLVTGKRSAKQSGAYQDVVFALQENDISFEAFDQVENNPSLETVQLGAALAKKAKADFVIGIGGGSPLDAAKAIAVLATNELTPDELLSNTFSTALPIVAIPTTAGTGSEVTPYSVLVRNDIGTKVSFGNQLTFPQLALVDWKYTTAVPEKTSVYTAIDAFTHSFEGYLSKRNTPLINSWALDAIAVFGECLQALLAGEWTNEIREKLMYVSLVGGMVITHTGVTSVHAMGYCYTYYQGIPHGQANAFLLRSYLQYLEPLEEEKIQKVMKQLSLESTEAFLTIIDSLVGLPRVLNPEEITEYSAKTMIQEKSLLNTAGNINKEIVRAMWSQATVEK
ncbi:iron-containing alcohol dehydrogenase family protein [Enterococcus sp. AZ109]|uniref:iron-containing alcohol dehydrogenase family protein n=1 Tax=Enterococcus sp. AZ109 TaxID=2774634 RepID=UPI003F204305